MANITNIVPPRVPIIDDRTGLISREWYRFFLDLFTLVGSGSNDTSISDLLVIPPLSNDDVFLADQTQLASIASKYDEWCSSIEQQSSIIPVINELNQRLSDIESVTLNLPAFNLQQEHNNLLNLQGGSSSQYYHLTSDKYSQISSAPVTKTADFTLAATERWVINNKSGSTCTATLPSATLHTGRDVIFQNYQAQLLVSASSNVVPIGGGAAGTAILAATLGARITLVSNGTNWVAMQ